MLAGEDIVLFYNRGKRESVRKSAREKERGKRHDKESRKKGGSDRSYNDCRCGFIRSKTVMPQTA